MTFPISHAVSDRPRTEIFLGDYLTGGDESAEAVFYVDKGGSDLNDGRSMMRPLATIEEALSKADAVIGTTPSWANNAIDGATIYLGPATAAHPHTIQNGSEPLTVPKNTTIRGAGIRACFLSPATPTNNGFALNSGCRVEHLSVQGFQLSPLAATLLNDTNPITTAMTGFVFCFASGANITRSPAIHDVTNHSFLGGGIHADGSILDNASLSRLMTTDAFTNVLSGGFAYVVDDDAYVEAVSSYCYTAQAHVLARNGGEIDLTNSKTGFSNYALIADGYRLVTYAAGYELPGKLYANGSLTVEVNGLDRTYTAGQEVPEGAAVKAGGATLRYGSRIVTNSHTMQYIGAGTDGQDDAWASYPPQQGGTGTPTNPERIAVASNHGVVIGQVTDESGGLRSINRSVTDAFSVAKDAQEDAVQDEIIQQSDGTIRGRNFTKSQLALMLPFFKSR